MAILLLSSYCHHQHVILIYFHWLPARYPAEVHQCLELFLPPDSAKQAAAAMASLTSALVSGLQEPGQLSPKLAALGSGLA